MQVLTLAENRLKGQIPQTIKNMGNLRTFSVHNNEAGTGEHSGPLPRFDAHPFLSEIYLDGNSFTGSIPHMFLHMFNQTDEQVTIGLSNNLLTGTVPTEFLKFRSLNLNVVGNNITGFAEEICDSGSISSWMNGLVEQFGCDAILCPDGYYTDVGRQEEESVPCVECEVGTNGLYGATFCGAEKDDISELEILAEFYLAVNGLNWDETSGWDVMADIESPLDLTLPSYAGVNHCNFWGIICRNDTNQVKEISLPSNGLEGMVPPSLFDLPALDTLDLSGNELHFDRDYGFGPIGNAKKLEKLDVSSNDIQKFSGIGQAKALRELYADDLYFFTGLDTELYQLPELRVLHMQYSGLRNEIPKGLSQLANLRSINLYGNELEGTIPSEIGDLPKLWHIDFSENDFTGHLPTVAIKNLLDLEKFHVHQSGRSKEGITGELPSFKEQTKLHLLDVSSNSMTGPIPTNFLSGVEDVDQLMVIDLGWNSFTGTIPSELSRFSQMNLDAVRNQFSGVSSSLCTLSGWMDGEVGKIKKDGGNGCDAILCPKGTYSEIGYAKSGSNGECLSCVSAEYAGETTCNGAAENEEKKILDNLYAETSGSNWKKGAYWTTGPICTYEGVVCESNNSNTNEGIVELRLSDFGLIGNIPTEIYQLPKLTKVDFSNNVVDISFDGIENAVNLESFIMSDADLSDLTGIGNAPPSLKKIHIERNALNYSIIPHEIYSLENLESLSIGFNEFGGKISPSISNLKSIQEFWAGSNDITGSIPHSISELDDLRSLVLSGNRMSGSIPNGLGNVTSLRQLHLNGQRDFGGFSGPVPSLNKSPHLHDIDFSRNSLTGSIPNDFLASVRGSTVHDDYAGVSIDMSSNLITGAIPPDFDDFASLFLNLAGNKITNVPTEICDDDDEFMDGLVGSLTTNKCDAILCRPGTFTPVGRQTEINETCTPCSGGESQAPYYGSTECKAVSGERETLQKIYKLIFTESSDDKYWMTDNPICTWAGITCNGDDSDDEGVIEIDLESNSLVADDIDEVSKLFFSLPNLRLLNLRGNDIPLAMDNIGSATNLKLLQLSATGLRDINGISAATSLEELHVTENDINGDFPEELYDMPNLERLYISFNNITGTLSPRIGELTNLKEFYAYTNFISGTIPTEIGKLENIENLVIGQNFFRGTIPTEINDLVHLREFSVYYEGEAGINGGLDGKLIDFAKATHLRNIDVEGNKLTGSIPSNFLSGLDTDFRSSDDNEIVLHLADNMLTGTLPTTFSNIKNLYIDIAGNQIKGPIPQSFCSQSLWMSGKVGEFNSCNAIACPAGYFSPSGRQKEGEDCTRCGALEVAPFLGSYECIAGDLEKAALLSFYDSTGGDNWKDNQNWKDASKPICSWAGVTCKGGSLDNATVTELNLNGNDLTGTMPSAIFELPFLEVLNVRDNDLYMEFGNIEKAEKLDTLYISAIDVGSIKGIGQAKALREIHLTGNALTGDFPEEIFDLADSLESLFIAYNKFSGTLSKRFGELKKLKDFYAYDNDFTGHIPSELAQLENLQNLVLAENKLSGTINEEFSSMPSLKLFSAYRRLKPGPKLHGKLPSFSNVPQLEGLYLDYNHLTGTIPKDFIAASLGSELITISHNLLTGPVPLSLDSFENLNIEMEGNKLSGLDSRFCDNRSWMNKAVALYDCDAILCPPHTYSIYGRQNSTESVCQKCDEDPDVETTPYWGSTDCDVPIDEKEILELLYSSCGGNDWYNKDNWLSSESICLWYGIDCGEGTTVQAIRLGANNLVGTPPEEIFALRQLHTLWLHSNPLEFKFKGIERSINLVDLRLDATGLSDVYGVGNAKALVKLDLKFNRITGPFPDELLNLETLEFLSLTDNRLTGTLPNKFEPLSNIISLRLGSNSFEGELPSFDTLPQLLHLDLSNNKLTGVIPGNFLDSAPKRKPVEIDISSNSLTGIVPFPLDEFDNLSIYLRDNKFTKLPESLCDSDNKGWNLRDVEFYGCDAIMCPPGTANFLGRQSSETTPCKKCNAKTEFYGQIECPGALGSSSGNQLNPFFIVLSVGWASLFSFFLCL